MTESKAPIELQSRIFTDLAVFTLDIEARDQSDRYSFRALLQPCNDCAREIYPEAKILGREWAYYSVREEAMEILSNHLLKSEISKGLVGEYEDICHFANDNLFVIESWLKKHALIETDDGIIYAIQSIDDVIYVEMKRSGEIKISNAYIKASALTENVIRIDELSYYETETIKLDPNSLDYTADQSSLEKQYIEKINPLLQDPYITQNDKWLAGSGITFESGSANALRDTGLSLFASWLITSNYSQAAEQKMNWGRLPTIYIYPQDQDGGHDASFNISTKSEIPWILKEAFRRLTSQNKFSGTKPSYDDGIRDRRSGYSDGNVGFQIMVDLSDTSHDQLAYLAKARAWLTENGFEAAAITEICGQV